MTNTTVESAPIPGEGLDPSKMPAYWLLARLGKRVLRPGGKKLTETLLDSLKVSATDSVVEFAPGMGATTRMLIRHHPASYTGIELDRDAVSYVQNMLENPNYTCRVGSAENTGVDDASSDVVFGEAILTMHPDSVKHQIAAEAFRILKPGGRLGIHELAYRTNTLSPEKQAEIRTNLFATQHVGVRPVPIETWREILEGAGFQIEKQTTASMQLLRARRVISDEGLPRALMIFFRAMTQPQVRARMRAMRANLQYHSQYLCAIGFVARKP